MSELAVPDTTVARRVESDVDQLMSDLLMEFEWARRDGIIPSDVLDRIESLAQADNRNVR